MLHIVQVRLREAGKIDYYDALNLDLKVGDYVIIEADRSVDYGVVMSEPTEVNQEEFGGKLKKPIRKANSNDLLQINKNKEKMRDALDTCQKKITQYKLGMKLIDGEYSFDRSKLIFYFTAEGRVDFRELVKDIAHIFRARIELKQIGVRDEAKMLGGFGSCGRPLCCKKFLKDFEPVTIRMAKIQNLSLNPTKISGLCGRLMCCLGYEYETYKQLRKGLPKEGDIVQTKDGPGKVIAVNVITRVVTLELSEGGQIQVTY